MFKKAMKDYVETSKNYSFTSIDSYKKFTQERDSYMTIVIERGDETKRDLYSKYLSLIKASTKEIAIIDLNEKNKESFKEYLSFIDIDSLTAFYSYSSEKDVYEFSENDAENKEFLNKYL